MFFSKQPASIGLNKLIANMHTITVTHSSHSKPNLKEDWANSVLKMDRKIEMTDGLRLADDRLKFTDIKCETFYTYEPDLPGARLPSVHTVCSEVH
jgi:hypothetical protein